MAVCRLLLSFLVLLQSGLAVAHAHAHPGHTAHTAIPHLHACELLELFSPADHHEHDDEGDHHDSDAVELSDAIASAPPAPEIIAVDLAPVETGAVVEVTTDRAFPLGLPPSTAGPQRPLYLTFCTLTI